MQDCFFVKFSNSKVLIFSSQVTHIADNDSTRTIYLSNGASYDVRLSTEQILVLMGAKHPMAV